MLRRCLLVIIKREQKVSVRLNFNFPFSQGSECQGPGAGSGLEIYESLVKTCYEQRRKLESHLVANKFSNIPFQALKSCKIIHACTLKHGLGLTGFLGKAILDLNAKGGSLDLAESVFDRLDKREVEAWNLLFSMYLRLELTVSVADYFQSMQDEFMEPNQFTYSIVLSSCSTTTDIDFGRQVHGHIIKRGLELNSVCESSLIDMYAKCNSMSDARNILKQTPSSLYTWTALILTCIRNDLLDEALYLFRRIQAVVIPDRIVSVAVLNALVRSGRLEEAFTLFSQLSSPNTVSWNIMISGHTKRGYEEAAVNFFVGMKRAGVSSTQFTLGSVLSAVAGLKALDIGLAVHGQAIKQGMDSNVYAASSLINMYAKCNELSFARKVFDFSSERNIVMWNAMLGGYQQNGSPTEVVNLFKHMENMGFLADQFTYTSILSACGGLEITDMGHQLHGVIIKRNYESNLFVSNALVDMYAKYGALPEARNVFERMKYHDNVSWNAMIVGLVKEDMEHEAFNVFCRMMTKGTMPDEVALASIISACANIRYLDLGVQMHGLTIKCGLGTSLYTGSSLIDLYVKCQATGSARRVFYLMPKRNVVSINALISGYAEHNMDEALNLYQIMHDEDLDPSEITFLNILDCCSRSSDFSLGQQIHSLVLRKGHLYDEILSVSLVGLYMKYHNVMDAHKLFLDFPVCKSTVLCTAMISGLNQNELYEEALELFSGVHSQNLMPDQASFVSVLNSCSGSASFRDGAKIHSLILQAGFVSDKFVCSALIDMYAKCGDMGSSLLVFQELDHKLEDVIAWNSIIVGFAKNGYAEEALKIFDDMINLSVKPDDVTFLAVLSACSHVGKITEGRQMFDTMTKHYGIQPRMDHCACMVDLLGRCGLLDEAESFINELNCEPGAVIWSSFLGACKLHGDEVRGRYAAGKLTELEPKGSSAYSLLSSIYTSSGNWGEADSLRKEMKEKGAQKSPAYSWIRRIKTSRSVSVNG